LALIALDDIKPGTRLRGLDPDGVAEIVQAARFGADANLVFRVNGRVGERLVYRGEEGAFERIEAGRAYGFDAGGALLRLKVTGQISASHHPNGVKHADYVVT
jgi:hypothetical protein